MNEWPLVFAGLGAITALGVLGHRIISQMMGRIDAMSLSLKNDVGNRFEQAEALRQESSSAWQDRLNLRDEALNRLLGRLEALASDQHALRERVALLPGEIAERYIARETYLEGEGRTFIKLEKILERINQLDNHHG